jgi:hypothetical protein
MSLSPIQLNGTPLIRYLDTNGNGTGTKTAIGNYSITPATFFIQPSAAQNFVITELVFQYSDSGGFPIAGYGSGAILTNGIRFEAVINGVTFDLLDGLRIKRNDDYFHLITNTKLQLFSGSGGTVNGSFNISDFGVPLKLKGATADKLQIILNDNFSLLVDQTFVVHGYF